MRSRRCLRAGIDRMDGRKSSVLGLEHDFGIFGIWIFGQFSGGLRPFDAIFQLGVVWGMHLSGFWWL